MMGRDPNTVSRPLPARRSGDSREGGSTVFCLSVHPHLFSYSTTALNFSNPVFAAHSGPRFQ